MRNINLPVWFGVADLPKALTFASLFSLVAFTRTILITIIPLQAHALLGDAQRVSVLYFVISAMGLCGSLAIPWLVHVMGRRWMFTVGVGCVIGAATLLSLETLPSLIVGMTLYVLAASTLEIPLNLYLMDHIGRRDLGRFEPLRLFFVAGVWTFGPWLGVFLKNSVAQPVPFVVAGAVGIAMLAYFWHARLAENSVLASATNRPPNPVQYIARYFRQPRLRLAWVLAVGRAAWWVMFFIYAPIYAVTAGMSEVVSGAIVSVGNAALFAVPIWGWLGRRYGFRRLLVAGYGLGGIATITVALAMDAPWLGVAILIGAALATSLVDGAGNVPFLRAVRPMERRDMTSVFTTYRYMAQIGPPGAFALLLQVLALPAVFVAGGTGMLVLAHYARYLPRRL